MCGRYVVRGAVDVTLECNDAGESAHSVEVCFMTSLLLVSLHSHGDAGNSSCWSLSPHRCHSPPTAFRRREDCQLLIVYERTSSKELLPTPASLQLQAVQFVDLPLLEQRRPWNLSTRGDADDEFCFQWRVKTIVRMLHNSVAPFFSRALSVSAALYCSGLSVSVVVIVLCGQTWRRNYVTCFCVILICMYDVTAGAAMLAQQASEWLIFTTFNSSASNDEFDASAYGFSPYGSAVGVFFPLSLSSAFSAGPFFVYWFRLTSSWLSLLPVWFSWKFVSQMSGRKKGKKNSTGIKTACCLLAVIAVFGLALSLGRLGQEANFYLTADGEGVCVRSYKAFFRDESNRKLYAYHRAVFEFVGLIFPTILTLVISGAVLLELLWTQAEIFKDPSLWNFSSPGVWQTLVILTNSIFCAVLTLPLCAARILLWEEPLATLGVHPSLRFRGLLVVWSVSASFYLATFTLRSVVYLAALIAEEVAKRYPKECGQGKA